MVLNANIEKEISEIAKKSEKSEVEIVSEAILIYKEYLNLLKEFELWDKVSDEDFIKFESGY